MEGYFLVALRTTVHTAGTDSTAMVICHWAIDMTEGYILLQTCL